MKFLAKYYKNYCYDLVEHYDSLKRQSYEKTVYRSLRKKLITIIDNKVSKDKHKPMHAFVVNYKYAKLITSNKCIEFKRQKYFSERILRNRQQWKFYRT